MICQHCKTDLVANGLQSYGHTLDQHFCCVCWFGFAIYPGAIPEDEFDPFYEGSRGDCPSKGKFIEALEDEGYHTQDEAGDDSPEKILEWLNNAIQSCDKEVESLRSEIDGQWRRKYRLEEQRQALLNACPHLTQKKETVRHEKAYTRAVVVDGQPQTPYR